MPTSFLAAFLALAASHLLAFGSASAAATSRDEGRGDDGGCSSPWGRAADGASLLQSKAKVAPAQMPPRADHEPKLKAPVCFFVSTDTAPEEGDGRARAAATAKTWAAEPAAGSRVFYFVDEAVPPYHLPASIHQEQIIKTVRAGYWDLPERTRSLLVRINTQQLLDKCGWFALVDDDTWVNTASVAAKTGLLDASELHYMGRKCHIREHSGGIVDMIHGSFKMFSAAAVPVIAEVAAQCRLWQPGWEDLRIAECLKESGFRESLHAEEFGNYVFNNSRTTHPSTLQNAMDKSRDTHTSLACFDFLHKMLPGDMEDFDESFRASPRCQHASAALIGMAA